MTKLLIKNGRIINPASNLDEHMDILIEDDKVKRIEKNIQLDNEDFKLIDAKDCIVSPGLIDIHVHFRDPGLTHKEDIMSGSKSAAAGGYTTVLLMANTNPKIDNIKSLQYVQEKAKKAPINILQEAALTIDFKDELVDMDALHKAGAVGFTNDGVAVMNTNVLRKAMIKAKELGTIIALHEEDNKLIGLHGINEGSVSNSLGLKGAPRVSEDVMVARDCMLALETGATIDIQHISSKNAVDMVQYAKSKGANVIAEVTPHHFTLTEDAVLEHSTLAKMNPPLRTYEDRERIISALADGTIDIIATDHAPHTPEEKSVEFSKAPSGIIGLETALSLTITELVRKNRLSLSQALSKLTSNPSTLYKLNKGDISEGKIADICIFNPNESYVVDKFYSKSSNSPFIGQKLFGKVKYTICSGKVVYSD
ncbi:dihydroorotase [Peptostreptococcus russellii]|uniref:Dihydroorotase n=1 Tax=Peptostreptococcus russellii TaxID=215200 RepID=A0A2P7Q1N3_9FIRM|nr:dihydroorotase [Peptostreptococcus russellii]PSJ31881.1 dihydroorotase [Peptostreptococcus russellii]